MDTTNMSQAILDLLRVPAVIAAARAADHGALSAEQLLVLNRAVRSIERETSLYTVQVTTLSARKEVHRVAGAASMGALVAAESGISRTQAHEQVRLAETIEATPVLREQMVKPGMSTAKAAVFAKAMDELPEQLDAAEREIVQRDLAEAAPAMSLEQYRRKARRTVEVVDVQLADELENQQLVEQERQQQRAATFWMTRPDETGMVKGGFEIDALTGDMLRSIIDSHTAPRKQNTCNQNTDNQNMELVAGDRQAHRRRQGKAFVEVIRYLPAGEFGNHGGVAATLMVTISEDSLRGRTDAAGTTEHGTRISAGQLRRIACGAGILPAVLDGKSQVIDLGTTRRLHSPAQRIALAQRDQGCAFPGCDRPPGWTEAHHIDPWSRGGPTTIDNGVLLCGTHHRQIHNSDWEVRMGHDKRPEFIPPKHVDPERKPRRNPIYQPLIA